MEFIPLIIEDEDDDEMRWAYFAIDKEGITLVVRDGPMNGQFNIEEMYW